MKKAKKILAFLFVSVFILSLPTPAAAASSLWRDKSTSTALEYFDLTESLIAEVQQDLLLGQISNPEATINLAVAQYLNLVGEDVPQVDNGGLPQIAQRIVAKIAGGAQMFANRSNSEALRVGERNVIAVKAKLKSLNISILSQDCGENFGRTVEFYSETGDYVIKAVGKPLKTI